MRLGYSASYLEAIFNPSKFPAKVKKVVLKVTELQKSLGFDAIAFRGNSGAAFAYPVGFVTGIPLICVRKGESSHGHSIEGPTVSAVSIKSYLILDDFVSTGSTVRAIVKEIREATWRDAAGNPTKRVPKCVGLLSWNEESTSFEPAPVHTEQGSIPQFTL